jgi:hypothetical protein
MSSPKSVRPADRLHPCKIFQKSGANLNGNSDRAAGLANEAIDKTAAALKKPL